MAGKEFISTVDGVTGLLRFVGILNAAIWLGVALFFTVTAAPALVSRDMQELLGTKLFPYLSSAMWQIFLTRYFYWHIVCAIVALLHLLAEWLYLGRSAQGFWLGVLIGLFAAGFLGGVSLAPKLRSLQRAQYAVNFPPAYREAAAKSFRVWHGVFQALNVLMIGGVSAYFWRVTNPTDELRFVGSTKFRG